MLSGQIGERERGALHLTCFWGLEEEGSDKSTSKHNKIFEKKFFERVVFEKFLIASCHRV